MVSPVALAGGPTVYLGPYDWDYCLYDSCFTPDSVDVYVGQTVTFALYGSLPGPHNVVADDGSFRCARGCDGDGAGGDGTPITGTTPGWNVVLSFDAPRVVHYHCEVHGESGVINVVEPPAFHAGPGLTGTWYDAGQSGHGFSIEVLPGEPLQLLAFWYVFAPQGGQAWVVAQGPISGTQAQLQAYQSSGPGALFPPAYDATQVQNQAWGTVTLTFDDCSHAHAEWVSAIPGYGSGGIDLVRLTQPLGVICEPPDY
jgi:plastocyanin